MKKDYFEAVYHINNIAVSESGLVALEQAIENRNIETMIPFIQAIVHHARRSKHLEQLANEVTIPEELDETDTASEATNEEVSGTPI